MTYREKTVCFLVGAPRSGTTWIQRLLQTHPLICGGEESHFFPIFASSLSRVTEMAAPDSARKIGPLCYIDQSEFEEILQLVRGVWSRIFRNLYYEHPQSLIHLEKTPLHAFYLDDIKLTFPASKIIFLTRDSRAVASSLVHAGRSWGQDWAPNNYKDAAIKWYLHSKTILDWRQRNPEHPFLQIRYEDALVDPTAELTRMLRFLFPESEDLRVEETLDAFEKTSANQNDPDGFSRLRGSQGWKADMPLRGKLTTWRYTRKIMRELGYGITPFH